MSGNDTAWLRMDRPDNLMTITGVIVLHEPVSLERVRAVVERRFLCFPRFRLCAERGIVGARWREDADFDIRRHVTPLVVRQDLSREALQDLVSDIVSEPLDPRYPRWRFQLVGRNGSGRALIMRVHHCYADGIALVQVLLAMTDTLARPVDSAGSPPAEAHHERPLLDTIAAEARALGRRGERLGQSVLHHLRTAGPEIVPAVLGKCWQASFDLARFVLQPPERRSRYRGRLGPAKRVAWADRIPLAEVKAIGKAYGCTVNDVLLACVAGALRGWLIDQHDPVDGLEINAAVPVNLRAPAAGARLGNHFGLVFLGIPLGIADPVERLYAVNARMRDLKKSYQPQISLGLLALVGRGPGLLQQPLLEFFSSKATAVMTNVPGPQQPLFFAGAEIDQLLFWVPQSGSIGVGVSILSYNGTVQFGLMADINLVPQPDQVISRVTGEFDKLVLATLLRPPDWPPGASGKTETQHE